MGLFMLFFHVHSCRDNNGARRKGKGKNYFHRAGRRHDLIEMWNGTVVFEWLNKSELKWTFNCSVTLPCNQIWGLSLKKIICVKKHHSMKWFDLTRGMPLFCLSFSHYLDCEALSLSLIQHKTIIHRIHHKIRRWWWRCSLVEVCFFSAVLNHLSLSLKSAKHNSIPRLIHFHSTDFHSFTTILFNSLSLTLFIHPLTTFLPLLFVLLTLPFPFWHNMASAFIKPNNTQMWETPQSWEVGFEWQHAHHWKHSSLDRRGRHVSCSEWMWEIQIEEEEGMWWEDGEREETHK